jgi:hypothetical protein
MKGAVSSDAVGVWQEAYEVRPDTSHLVYVNMPPAMIGKATTWTPAGAMPPQAVRRKPVGLLYPAEELEGTSQRPNVLGTVILSVRSG